ncbi:helix-turn-helix domain-containing protein [Lancefieldella rimae]
MLSASYPTTRFLMATRGQATPFDGLMSFSDASELWGLSESTLRKTIAYGKIVPGVDACKYGKQWVVDRDAMLREHDDPVGV